MQSNDAATGMRLAQMGRFAEALPHLDRANMGDPADVSVLHAAASLLQGAGRAADAARRYETAAGLLPSDTGVLVGWARSLLLAGDEESAILPLDRALVLDPHVAASDGTLRLLWNTDERDLAARVLRQLVARHPDNSDLLCQLAQILRAAEYLDEVESVWRRYMELRPDDPLGPVETGRLAVSRGDTDTARALFMEALRIAPDDPRALAEFAHLERGFLNAEQVRQLTTAVEHVPDAESGALLSDVLARHDDRIGAFATAAAHVARMNAFTEQSLAAKDFYDADLHAAEVAFAARTYSPGLFARLRGAGSDDRRPVFVVGLPRSGTTLLERMLAAHPAIAGVGEQSFVREGLLRALAAGDGLPESLAPADVDASATWHLQQLNERLRRLGIEQRSERIVDKLPDNYLLAGWIRIVFPNAMIVHSLRDPRDVAWSCWSTLFAKVNWSLRLDQIAHRIEQHRLLMRHWRSAIDGHMTEVRYERLIENPEGELRRILSALGLEWHPDVMDFAQQKGFVASASRHQVRERIHSRSVGRWRNFADALQPVLPRLEAIVAQDAREAPVDLILP